MVVFCGSILPSEVFLPHLIYKIFTIFAEESLELLRASALSGGADSARLSCLYMLQVERFIQTNDTSQCLSQYRWDDIEINILSSFPNSLLQGTFWVLSSVRETVAYTPNIINTAIDYNSLWQVLQLLKRKSHASLFWINFITIQLHRLDTCRQKNWWITKIEI